MYKHFMGFHLQATCSFLSALFLTYQIYSFIKNKALLFYTTLNQLLQAEMLGKGFTMITQIGMCIHPEAVGYTSYGVIVRESLVTGVTL